MWCHWGWRQSHPALRCRDAWHLSGQSCLVPSPEWQAGRKAQALRWTRGQSSRWHPAELSHHSWSEWALHNLVCIEETQIIVSYDFALAERVPCCLYWVHQVNSSAVTIFFKMKVPSWESPGCNPKVSMPWTPRRLPQTKKRRRWGHFDYFPSSGNPICFFPE